MLAGFEALSGNSSLTSVVESIQSWWEGLFPIHTYDDISATVAIDTETHEPARTVMMPQTYMGPNNTVHTILMPIHRDAYDTFTVTIEGKPYTIEVSPENAARYNPGDRIEVTYDKREWKDGTVRIDDIRLKKH